MSKKIISRAVELFRLGDIAGAYVLYKQAAAVYGDHVVAYNLKYCEKLLHSQKLKLYSSHKTRISILITSKNNIATWNEDVELVNLFYDISLFFYSQDGIRPLHDLCLLDFNFNKIVQYEEPIKLPVSDYTLIVDPECTLKLFDVEQYLAFKRNEIKVCPKSLRELDYVPTPVHEGKVSIIIPTYKRPANLELALESVALQNYNNKEIIVVNDNGNSSLYNQETQSIVSNLRRKYDAVDIRLIEHIHNRNGAAARNTGLMHARGEYICFLDDDDIYLEDRLLKSIHQLINSSPDCGAVYCGFLGWNSKGNDITRYKKGNLTKEILLFQYEKHYLHTDTVTYKRDAIFKINGFDETYQRHQDIEFNLRFFKHYTMDVMPEILVQLNPKPSDISNKVTQQDLLRLKLKFLKKFRREITQFSPDIIADIFLRQIGDISINYKIGV